MKRKSWWLLLVLGLAGVILACVVTPAVTVEPTESSIVEEPTEPPDTPVPPTATPVPPTDTPVPPTATPVLPTDTPSPTEVPTSTPSSAQVVTQASGACEHPYYPVRSDTAWVYEGGTGYTVTFDDIRADSFTSSQTFPGSTTESLWLCTDEGLIPSEITAFMFFEMPGFEFETVGFSGALLPLPEDWEAGATWETGYDVQATTRVLGLAVRSQVDVSVDNQIVGEEQVVVPAGTYPNATRIDSTGTALVNAPGMQTEAPFTFSHWYVEDLGLVKLSANVQGTPFEMVLSAVEE
jgi:hypothetical protein